MFFLLLTKKTSGDIAGTREAYKFACEQYPDSKFLWTQALYLELQYQDAETLSRLQTLWESMYLSSLAPEAKYSLGRRFSDYLYEYAPLVSDSVRLDVQLSLVARYIEPVTAAASTTRKRSMAATNGSTKAPRLDGEVSVQSVVSSGAQ